MQQLLLLAHAHCSARCGCTLRRSIAAAGLGLQVVHPSYCARWIVTARCVRAQAMVQAWFTQINAQHRDPRSRDQEQERSEREAHNRAVRLQVRRVCAATAVYSTAAPRACVTRSIIEASCWG